VGKMGTMRQTQKEMVNFPRIGLGDSGKVIWLVVFVFKLLYTIVG